MKPRPSAFLPLLLLLLALPATAQWNEELRSPGAAEQLRLGVLAYNQGRIGESILLFEKALAWDPGEPLILDWLGRAYYRSGFEATALKTWEPLLSRPEAPAALRSFVETLRARRSLPEDAAPPRYIEAHRFEGRAKGGPAFLRPSSLLALPDGSFYVVAQGSGQVLRLDANGGVKEKLSGGLEGFDRPFGLTRAPDGSLFVSEFNGDRISLIRGSGASRFASKGRGEGQLLGPQFLALDSSGYLYVSDYGNARVLKFDGEGKSVLSFGAAQGDFPGFRSPTGIAWVDGVLYVADAAAKTIYSFDESGNYLGSLAEGLLHFPEGLSSWEGGRALLIADTDQILSFDLGQQRLDLIYRSPDAKPRLTSAVADFRGGILACDFDASSISLLSEALDLARGFDVQISRIDASAFPAVRVSIDVRDRLGRPVVGLDPSNFYLSETLHSKTSVLEGGKTFVKTSLSVAPAQKLSFQGSGTASPGYRCVALVERSRAMQSLGAELGSLLAEFGASLGPGEELGAVSAGPVPLLLARPSATPDLASLIRGLRQDSQTSGRFDLGLRQGVNALLPTGPRDALVYFSTGTLDEGSLRNVGVSELAALLANNGIAFHLVLLGDGSPDPALRYLVAQSGGSIIRAEGPRGIADLPALLRGAPSGRYDFSFVSADDPDFGTRQLSLAVEVWLFQKSGRDELGYYAPLQ